MKLKNKVALVTGACGGLGKAIAVAMAREGAHIVACDVNEHGLAGVEQAVTEAGAQCLPRRCDVSSSAEVARMFQDAVSRFGTVDVLVNNAALVPSRPEDEARRRRHYAYLTTPVPRESLEFTSSLSDEDWHRYWGVNVHGVFYCTCEALRLQMVHGRAANDAVAQTLEMHRRTLHRRLRECGTTFRQVLDEVRYDTARHFLCTTDMPLTEIAVALGYSEVTAFTRAFRRWSGETPSRFRETGQATTPDAQAVFETAELR
jgi:AraC-like DNA-binding protein